MRRVLICLKSYRLMTDPLTSPSSDSLDNAGRVKLLRLVLVAYILVLIGIFAGGAALYRAQDHQVHKQVEAQLLTIADVKTSQAFFDEIEREYPAVLEQAVTLVTDLAVARDKEATGK